MTDTKPAPTVIPGGGLEGGETDVQGGRRVKGATVKQLKRMLKKAGLKTTGRRAALTRRAKKAHLKMKGGMVVAQQGGMLTPLPLPGGQEGGKKKKGSRKSRGFKLF